MYKSKRIQTGLTGLLLAGLLVGCTASVTPPPAGQAQAVQGFEVAGQSDIDRRKVTLPPLTTMAVPTTLQAQSAGPSPLPTWTGPRSYRLAYTSLYANAKPQLALNSRGDVYLNTALAGYSEAGLPVLQKLTSNGQLLGSQTAKADPNTYLLNSFVVVTEDDSQREAYHLFAGPKMYMQAHVYGSDMEDLNPEQALDVQHPIPADYGQSQRFVGFPQKEGITVSESVMDQHSGLISYVTVSDLAAEPWREVGLREKVTLRFPKAYASREFSPTSVTAVASDGSTYVAMYTHITEYQDQAPGIAGITKIKNGNVEWQVYWDEPQALRLEDIAANDQGVHVLFNRSIHPSYPRLESTILSLDASGQVTGNRDIPLDALRDTLTQVDPLDRYYVLPPLTNLKVDNAGRLAAFNQNAILTGTVGQSLEHSFVLNDGSAAGKGWIHDVVFQGDYLYAEGMTGEAHFLRPMDFQLRSR